MNRQRGFSLLEVIAAVLLLAIAFTALLKVAGSSLALTARAEQRSKIMLWARSTLDSTLAAPSLQEGSSEGRFDAIYRWRLTVTRAQPFMHTMPRQGQALRLYRLELQIFWGAAPRQHSVHFSTLRLLAPPLGSLP